jgi:signal transduction histidine kinase/DNA-binding NarL/FixJ family response regulator
VRLAVSVPIDVLVLGDDQGSWLMRMRILLEAFGHRCTVAKTIEEAQLRAHDVDVVVVHVTMPDPLVQVAALWGAHAALPVVLAGDNIAESMRAAAFEAGVAFVTRSEPLPEELDALLRMVCEQNKVGSPELVRAMCRTMCSLSTLVASATDGSFLALAVQEVSALFTAPVVSIMLFEAHDAAASLNLVAQVGLDPNVLKEPPRRGGIADHVVATKKPRIVLRRADDHAELMGVTGRAEITASMCVPIPGPEGGNGRPRGVINVARRRPYAVFTPRDLDVCVSIAGLIGEALTMLEARATSAALRERMTAVERLSTMGEIAAGIAHEIANPISAVRSNVDVIIQAMTQLGPVLAAADHDPELREIIDDLPELLCETWEGLARTDEIIRQMKALIRLDGGISRDERVVLGVVVDDTLRLLRPRLKVPVRTEISRDAHVRGSSAELSQVIVNLVVNASDACDELQKRGGRDKPEVLVKVESDGEHAVVKVIDNGTGIPPDALQRIFLPLFTTKPSDRGTGLGLAIVRRIAEENGGTIDVSSQVGVGTTFTVTLPRLAMLDERSVGSADRTTSPV